ncbi:putative CCA tRNA nucleotidyltransferase 2 [Dendrobium catenatum]|uniref:tRNA nucleotidyltransferase (CCA-adding enzyme) n=1 Tax=Dendrobium catenatum TaxID=906689 RepID=A0A2I0WXK9_9ASPA|nr:putative CCA tRNA nucleotidyltransferase 2 [Dendrobium catenatum]PKU80395.1 tRNA nucleotidyltransferase (CCA-adding enzyme) [Dendrobium catenatum]
MDLASPSYAKLLTSRRIASHRFCFLSTQAIFFIPSKRTLGFPCLGVRCRAGVSTMVAEPRTVVKDRIDLTENEGTIFRRLLDVVDHFKLNTQLRVAGGWVRDKLLGKDCYDIDIALDNMLGREFCEKVNEYLHSAGEEQQGIGVIQCNPDQSKHLETARMRICSTWVDFVNLRSESYAENSRIPKMKFGTAKEDAYRRDLTINSLFYNINTTSVEDLTGRGVQDLKDGYIVTPLPPKETFLDDPLRVLRAIRFGARFNFKLNEDLKEAASDDEVRDALMCKISRERIGHEIDLMISGNQPVRAMFYICDLQLFYAVFTLPENAQPEIVEGCNRLCVSHIDAAWNVLQLVGCSTFSDEQRRLYLYGALFLPLRNTAYTDTKPKKIPVANFIIRNSLKLKANDAEMVVSLHVAVERFISLFPFMESDGEPVLAEVNLDDEFLDIPPTSRKRVLAGLLLREIKSFWRVALLMSTLLRPIDEIVGDSLNKESERRKEIFTNVERIITDLGLDNAWEVKPLLDGKAIMGVLQLKGGGPLIREWQQRMIKWQLAHPNATAEECLDWMQQSQSKRAKLDCYA